MCYSELFGMVGWLNLLNAELSPKRYWWGQRSKEVGEEGTTPHSNTPPE